MLGLGLPELTIIFSVLLLWALGIGAMVYVVLWVTRRH